MKKALLCTALFVFILLLDALTKYATVLFLPWHHGYAPAIVICRNFFGIELYLTHATNLGAAWGVFARFSSLLFLFRLAFITFLFLYMIIKRKALFPLTLILAGATGNVLDFFLYGHVIDMIHFVFWGYSYPIFNLADVSISIGVLCLIGEAFFKKKKSHVQL